MRSRVKRTLPWTDTSKWSSFELSRDRLRSLDARALDGGFGRLALVAAVRRAPCAEF